MIRARPGGPLAWLAHKYVDLKVRHAFRAVWIRGELPRDDAPLLAYANHSSFWDGFIAHQLCRATGRRPFCAMEERNLRRYPFLARLGAFSIRRHDGLSALETFRYARALLQVPRNVVFIFPEGELAPFGSRPLRLERGVEVLARISQVRCLPLAFRCTVLEHELPDVFIEVGEAHPPAALSELDRRLGVLVDRVARVTSVEEFAPLVRGRAGVAQRWSALRRLRSEA